MKQKKNGITKKGVLCVLAVLALQAMTFYAGMQYTVHKIGEGAPQRVELANKVEKLQREVCELKSAAKLDSPDCDVYKAK